VLGEDFAEVDGFPTRVRLPDEPLMLVDGILTIEGRPRSLERGRVVTEHFIHERAWYLDGDRIAPCIAIEAGQADLVLSAYLGVDFATKGLAVYRLLDATVTFHRGLPVADEVIRYDIRITRFFRQGKTILFRFQFDATVQSEPLLTMRDGCAGFFTAEELAAGKGIVPRGLDIRSRQTTGVDDPSGAPAALVPMSPTIFVERQLDALRNGDLMIAFGSPFDRLELDKPLTLPVGRMALVHRVVTLDPTGGYFKAGLIRAEADIHPGDWFMVCHFIDDRVMPGTLMYECCLHTLRIFLLRMGWIGPRGKVAFEPVPGVANRLKCRGQITESTRVVMYEVTIKELGYRPEPYAIGDALILADGKPIVEITDMALQLSGTNRQELERLWAGTPPAVFSHAQVLAFAVGKPSDAFGDRYRPFDEGRFISRLPGPPYQFLDRIVRVDAEPWIMVAGGSAEAEYDIQPDAWFFAADRQDRMPLALLLEVALQACGWLAAYMGSALTTDHDMHFRNLGGAARQHRLVTRATGTLTTRVKVTKIASTAGMILQNYDFTVHSRDGLVYDGSTEFGFFHPRLLLEQVGIRDAAPYEIKAEEQARAQSFEMPSDPPFPASRLRMIDQVDLLVLDGGPQGLGVARASTRVDPDAWFFKAHFLHDPVWPGSLGLESLLQLLKIVAASRWGVNPGLVFESPALELAHHWTYRGQIVPANRRVIVQAEIKVRDDDRRQIVADGYLDADGRTIYQMKDFSVRLSHG
jgi:3-hydroxymyristoyl/3-hydroxydecanoyl-(acyl carrier protein) dehydratase